MKKLMFAVALLAFAAAPALAGPYIALPSGWINFDGNGNFDQTVPGAFDAGGLPLPIPVGAQVFGVGTISDAALLADLGSPVWLPADVGPNFEMTYSFWSATVVASGRTVRPDPVHLGQVMVDLWATYADDARLALVSDTTKDYTAAPGPGPFNLVTGYYPTANELPLGTDLGESLYLDLSLNSNSSLISWSSWTLLHPSPMNPLAFGFLNGSFSAFAVEINGGYGATQFIDGPGSDGQADAFVFRFQPLGWAYGADTDIQLQAVPEPAALMSLFAGLALLGGYRLRRRS